MSTIIELFLLAYLAVIVMVSLLSIVWAISLLFGHEWSMGKVSAVRMHRQL